MLKPTVASMGTQKYEFGSDYYTRDELVEIFLDKTYRQDEFKLNIEDAKACVRELTSEFKLQEVYLAKLVALLHKIDTVDDNFLENSAVPKD